MNIFMLRSKPHGIERIGEFLRNSFIAIGWTDTKDLTSATKEDIREALINLGYEGQSLLTNLGLINAFVRTMSKGDLVLTREQDVVHIGIVGDYHWEETYVEEYMAHTRSVEWIAHVPFHDLNASMQSLLKNIRTICKYKGTYQESGLDDILNEPDTSSITENVPHSKKEQLLSSTLDTLEELMNNAKDETVRLEAAKELLKSLKG